MPRTLYNSQLATRTARLKLEPRRASYFVTIGPGVALGYRRTKTSGTWSVRVKSNGADAMKRFAIADDYEDGNGKTVMTYYEAARTAAQIGRRSADNICDLGSASLEQQIAAKWATFKDVDPACCLYRHYDSAGELLYVGISLSPLRRHEKHFAAQRYQIYRILIEPFASRNEALCAEECAIRDEFPKFNAIHNRRRHPAFEFRQVERAAT